MFRRQGPNIAYSLCQKLSISYKMYNPCGCVGSISSISFLSRKQLCKHFDIGFEKRFVPIARCMENYKKTHVKCAFFVLCSRAICKRCQTCSQRCTQKKLLCKASIGSLFCLRSWNNCSADRVIPNYCKLMKSAVQWEWIFCTLADVYDGGETAKSIQSNKISTNEPLALPQRNVIELFCSCCLMHFRHPFGRAATFSQRKFHTIGKTSILIVKNGCSATHQSRAMESTKSALRRIIVMW